MQYITEIIPHTKWVHTSGRQASIYGAVPWTTEADKPNWTMETRGYTWAVSDGTVGICRAPAKTYAEAVETANKFNGHARNCGIDAPIFE